VVVTPRVKDGVAALEGPLELAAAVQGTTRAGFEDAVRDRLGISPLSLEDIGAAGIAVDGSAAVFGQNGFPTAILPVADAERMRGFLDRKRPERNAEVSQHRGHSVVAWAEGELSVSWVQLDGWLVVRAAPGRGLEWLDEILAAPGGGNLGGDAELAGLASASAAALGMIRTARLAREVEDWRGAPAGLAGCVRSAAEVAPRVVATATGSDLRVSVDLVPAAATALRDHSGPAAPGGFYRYREKTPLAFAFAVGLPFLEKVRKAAGCPFLARPIRDPVRAMTGISGPRAWYGAFTRIDVDDLDGAGAVHLVLTDPDLISAQLEAIPGRSLFERKRTIAGRSVRSLSVPGLPAILYLQEGRRFTVALGGDAMGAVLGSGAAPERPELAAVRIEPGRLRNLGRLVAAAVRAANLPAGAAASLTEALRRVERASLVVELEADSLVMRAGMRLRK
jgi:hypothetical protein